MSRFVTKVGDKFIEEIESMELCKCMINEVCCNEKCHWLGSYTFNLNCDSEEDCKYFVKEDGIIEVAE